MTRQICGVACTLERWNRREYAVRSASTGQLVGYGHSAEEAWRDAGYNLAEMRADGFKVA
jgi:hypothetical protein